MKLLVQIPAYNEEQDIAEVIKEIPRQIPGVDSVEVLVVSDGSSDKTVEVAKKAGADYIIDRKINRKLAKTFKEALEKSLEIGADIVVNTDGDNHYDQTKIPKLIQPILDGIADVTIGSRNITELKHMPISKRYGNLMGSYVVCKLAGIPTLDASTGFRAYTRDAALRLNVLSDHTYTHETFFQMVDQKLRILEVPISARDVNRASRLIKSVFGHVKRSMAVILTTLLLYKPLKVFLTVGAIFFAVGAALAVRFLYLYFTTSGEGHVQSLILSALLMILGFQIGVIGLVASAVGWNRKIIEEVLYWVKKKDLSGK
ncbi:MAG: glycosyl transferase family 2 [uncultured bacterium]|nr:MAG: glycosyl transferase family 2 [uncultured bacterium]